MTLLKSLRLKQYESLKSVEIRGTELEKQIEELKKERTGVIYSMSIHKEGDSLDGKIVNVG